MYGVSAVERADAVRQQLAEDGHALVCRWSAGRRAWVLPVVVVIVAPPAILAAHLLGAPGGPV